MVSLKFPLQDPLQQVASSNLVTISNKLNCFIKQAGLFDHPTQMSQGQCMWLPGRHLQQSVILDWHEVVGEHVKELPTPHGHAFVGEHVKELPAPHGLCPED